MDLDKKNHPEEGLEKQQEDVFYKLTFFTANQKISQVHKNIERICGALFLITNQVKDSEISKNMLREEALLALKISTTILSDNTPRLEDIKKLYALITNIHSLLDISFWAGFISQMNSAIVQKQLLATATLIEAVQINGAKQYSLDSRFFNEEEIAIKDNILKDNIKDNKEKNVLPYRKPLPIDITNNKSNLGKVISGFKRERQNKIISFLKDKNKEASIKDVSLFLPQIGEKTIQRDLVELLKSGLIKKTGDRRWSMYSIVTKTPS